LSAEGSDQVEHGAFGPLCAGPVSIRVATIQFFETNKREPIPNNLAAIRRALEDGGVEFIPGKSGKGVGVRLREV
jgi:hypothetical protein